MLLATRTTLRMRTTTLTIVIWFCCTFIQSIIIQDGVVGDIETCLISLRNFKNRTPTLLFKSNDPPAFTDSAGWRSPRLLLVLTSLDSISEALRIGTRTEYLTSTKNVTVHVVAMIRDVPEDQRGRAASCALTLLHTFAQDLGRYPARFSVIYDDVPWPFAFSNGTSVSNCWQDAPDSDTLPFLAILTPVRLLTLTRGSEREKTRWLQQVLETLF